MITAMYGYRVSLNKVYVSLTDRLLQAEEAWPGHCCQGGQRQESKASRQEGWQRGRRGGRGAGAHGRRWWRREWERGLGRARETTFSRCCWTRRPPGPPTVCAERALRRNGTSLILMLCCLTSVFAVDSTVRFSRTSDWWHAFLLMLHLLSSWFISIIPLLAALFVCVYSVFYTWSRDKNDSLNKIFLVENVFSYTFPFPDQKSFFRS